MSKSWINAVRASAIGITSPIFWLIIRCTIQPDPSAIAQVIPDGTLATTVRSSDNLNFVIEGGELCCVQTEAEIGPNLFHSFEEFSVPRGGEVRFNNVSRVINIFSRVTGESRSHIQGILSANHQANLFLINPNGIIFGPNASLDVGGSFISTTAEQILFEDGLNFETTADVAPLLSMTSPIGLQFGQQSGPIRSVGHEPSRLSRTDELFLEPFSRDSNRVHLHVPGGETLALLGNGVFLNGSNIVANSGHIEIAGIQSGEMSLVQKNGRWQFGYDNVEQFSDVRLRSQSTLDASGLSSQGIQVVGDTIQFQDGSLAFIQDFGQSETANITVMASDRVEFKGTSPDVSVPSGIRYELLGLGDGTSGDITVTASDLSVLQGAEMAIANYGNQDSGNSLVTVDDQIRVDGVAPQDAVRFSRIAIGAFAEGDSGDITLIGRQISLLDGATVTSITGSEGNGGDVLVKATDRVEVTGFAPASAGALRTSSELDASTVGSGDAGSVTIYTNSLYLESGNISSTTLSTGDAGDIIVEAETIEVFTPTTFFTAELTSAAEANNPIQELLDLPLIPTGNAGSILLRTSKLQVPRDGTIAVENEGIGDGGNIEIYADVVTLNEESRISAETISGQGGNLELAIQDLVVLKNESFISSESEEVGDGGNIDITGPFLVAFNNSDIIANAVQGDGGNITLTTPGLYGIRFQPRLTLGNDITASSTFGLNGSVSISAPDVDPSSQILELPETLADLSQAIRAGCSLDEEQFVMAGRGGLPSNPLGILSGDRPWPDLRNPLSQNDDTLAALPPATVPSVPAPIQEATGMTIAPNGTLQLIASHPQNVAIPYGNCTTQANT